jgi:hypothetical protein
MGIQGIHRVADRHHQVVCGRPFQDIRLGKATQLHRNRLSNMLG